MALPNKIYALLRNLVYLEIEGAVSVTLDDAANVLEVYDLETHRNLFDAGTIGRAWAATVVAPFATGQEPEGADDRLNAVPPIPTLKNRTMIYWWNAAGGTGDKIAMCWSDQFIGYCGAPPRFVQ